MRSGNVWSTWTLRANVACAAYAWYMVGKLGPDLTSMEQVKSAARWQACTRQDASHAEALIPYVLRRVRHRFITWQGAVVKLRAAAIESYRKLIRQTRACNRFSWTACACSHICWSPSSSLASLGRASSALSSGRLPPSAKPVTPVTSVIAARSSAWA